MSKLIAAAVLVMLWTAVAAAGDAAPGRTINLNEPGALEALQHSNPTHYEKVRKIVEGLMEECLKKYEGQGYIRAERLTPQQRADLERRGVLPNPEPPPRMGYY